MRLTQQQGLGLALIQLVPDQGCLVVNLDNVIQMTMNSVITLYMGT
jgi:hypothetical protein